MLKMRGEYWICDDGQLLEADGTVGDKNHQGHALDTGIGMLWDVVNDSSDVALREIFRQCGRPDDYDGDVVGLREALNNAVDAYQRAHPYQERIERLDDYDQCLREIGACPQLLAALFDRDTDPRDWARKRLGWISVVPQWNAALYALTDKSVRQLRDGLWDILECEGHDPAEPQAFDNIEVAIQVVRTDTRYYVSWDTLQQGRAALLAPQDRKTTGVMGAL